MPLHTRDRTRLAFLKPVPQDFYEPCDTWTCNHCNQDCPYKNCPMCLRGNQQDGLMRRCHSFCMQHGFYMLFFLLITVIVTLFFVQHVEKK